EDEVGVWNDDFPAMPTAVLGDGTTLELRPLPLPDIDGNSPRLSFQEIFQEKSDSVVLVEVQLRMGRGSGTGVIMTENGYIITSAHVVEDARAVHVTLQDGTRFEAAIVGMDANTDIAVLKIDATDLSPAEFGDSDLLQVGEEVAVIGNPLGHLHSMSNGIVSALDRDVVYDGITMRLIQTNAAINEGNSGGPLFNLYGQVVGITNMKLVGHFNSIEGMGFAVPTALLKPVVESIIEHGRVVGRPALGVIVRSVDELDAIIEGVEPGVYIQRVLEDTDAYAQGLQEDDRIVSANGAEIISSFDLREQILSFTAGDTITLVIERDGEEIELQVRLMDADLLEF
ncbi:MAG: trypsin-like peptidase domain-containing protein, partial [Oscillospiraceae bacterium]|nr:trypsin-like peptidase domain-containing protein [Oscillospiraceae bacterium]